jgi:hypothetical protein
MEKKDDEMVLIGLTANLRTNENKSWARRKEEIGNLNCFFWRMSLEEEYRW